MKNKYIIFQAYLHLLAFALLMVGSISLIGYQRIDLPTVHTVVLLPDSALLCILLGLTLLAASRRQDWLLRSATAAIMGLCLYSLIHNYLAGGADVGISWISGFLRIRSSLAVTMLLWVLGLTLSFRGPVSRKIAQAIGLLLVSLATFSQIVMWHPDLDLFRLGFKHASSIAGLFTVLLGVALVVLGVSPVRQKEVMLDRVTLCIGVISAFLTCISWYLLSVQAADAVSQRSKLLLSKTQSAITRDLSIHLQLMHRMAERWEKRSWPLNPELLKQEAQSYLRDFPSLGAIAVINLESKPYWLEARGSVYRDGLLYFLSDPVQQQWLSHVQRDNQAHISSIRYSEVYKNYNSLIAIPLHLKSQQSNWFLVATFDVQSIFDQLIGNNGLNGFVIQVYDSDAQLFTSNPQVSKRFLNHVSDQSVQLHHDLEWRLVSYLDTSQGIFVSAYLPALVMLFGLSLSLLLMISQRLGSIALEHSKRLEVSLHHQESMQRLHQRIMEFSHDVLCSTDAHGHFLEISPSCERVFGYAPEEMIGRAYMDFVLADDYEKTQLEASRITHDRPTRFFRNRYRHRDGRIIHILWTSAWSDEEQTRFAVAHDITRLVQNEVFADTQRQILRMITLGQPLGKILTEICLMIEAQDPRCVCSILLTNPEKTHLTHGAAPNLPLDFIKGIDGLPIGPASSNCGAAAFLRKAIYTESIQENPLWDNYRDLALSHGFLACWSTPLIDNEGEAIGTFAIYQRQAHKPNEEQLQLLSTAEQLAAIAIERSQSLQRLEESEQRFRSLFSLNPDPIYSLDLKGFFQSVNDAGLKIIGLSREEIVGNHYTALVIERDLFRVATHFEAASRGLAQRYEVRIGTPYGEILMDVTNQPIVVNNQIVGVFGIAKDITERRVILEQLQQKNLLLSMAGHTAKLGGWALVLPEHSMVWSEETRALLEFPSDVIPVWDDILPLHPEPFRTRAEEAMRQCVEQGINLDYDIEIHTARGRLIQARITAQPVRDDEGQIVRIVGSFQDISERKKAEHQLQATLVELERSNRELQEFAYVASHDLQEPLRKIQAFSERLAARADTLDEDGRDYLQRMSSAASRMQALIIDLLNYSRVNTRGQSLQSVNLNDVASEVLDDIEATIEQAGAHVQISNLPLIMGDAVQLRQVLQNLISNALKFQASDSKPVINVYAEQGEMGDWTLFVADNGIGFDEKYLDRIFNPFQRLHSRETYKGTGIGLAIVKKIVERHNAHITANSTPGKGSVFRITFPNPEKVFA